MKIHGSARTCPKSRKLLCQRIRERGWTVQEATEAAGVSVQTGYKWLARYQAEGEAGLVDRTSRPNTTQVQTPNDRVAAIVGLRQLRMTGAQIAEALAMPLSTVGEVLRRVGLGQLRSLEPEEPPNRYERRHPGELIHIDVKKLARIKRPGHRVHGDRSKRNPGGGWEFVHVCVDDATRVTYVEVLADEKGPTAVGFLRRAVAFYRSLGVEVQRVMTDNGGAYVSAIHAVACRLLGIRHIRTRPYRPRTNGKAERFIRTMLNECLYAAIYQNSDQRRAALAAWLERYNERRPHGSLGRQAPMTRLRQSLNNVLGAHI
ncbi:MAG: IS481 family transposase [Actinomycetota bacterium]